MRNHSIAPGLRQRLPLPLGLVAEARRDPLRFYRDGMRRYGDIFRLQIGGSVFHTLFHPDHIKHVLQDHSKNYPRSWYFNMLRLAVGDGLVTTEGEPWRRLRRLVQPAFHRERIAVLGSIMTRAAGRMLERWQGNVASGEPLDMAVEMMRLTIGIVGEALFGSDISGETDAIGRASNVLMEYLNYRINHLFAPHVLIPTPRNLRFRRAMRTLDKVIYRIIAERRHSLNETGDLLSTLLRARDEETGAGMSDKQLRDSMLTFIGAGYETTSVALTWTWYLLSQYPAVAKRLRAELASVLGGRAPAVADLPNLTYTRKVIDESIRLYPPVWAIMRDAVKGDEIGGYHIPARSSVILCPYTTHRHPALWPDPDQFDPERFAPELSAGRPR